MKNIVPAIIVCLIAVLAPSAIAGDGSLGKDTIEDLRSSFTMDSHNRAMYNSVTGNDINALALNRDVLSSHNEIFSDKIKTKGITNQKRSGTCWLFAGMNMLRSGVMTRNKLESFEFSENYLFFWDKLEKANCFYDRMIRLRDSDLDDRRVHTLLKTPMTDGGYWESIVNLVEKYGIVPRGIMPATHSTNNSRMMNKLIARKMCADTIRLRKMHSKGKSVKKLNQAKKQMLTEVYKMLVLNLGTPPEKFQWRFEDANSLPSETVQYTPQSFYKEFAAPALDEYVDIFNDPSKEMGKHYEVEFSTNMIGGQALHFVNVDIEMLKKIALTSVKDDQPLWFATDVSQHQYKDKGVMAGGLYDYDSIYNIDMNMTKAQRLTYRQSIANHAMVFTGVDISDDKPVKWLIENSWGDELGNKGKWTMYDNWFDEYVYMLIVKKKYVPTEILEIFKQKPTMVPPWDPMYSLIQ